MKIYKKTARIMEERGSIMLLPLKEEPSPLFDPTKDNRFTSRNSIYNVAVWIVDDLVPTEYEVVDPESLKTLGYFTSSAIIKWLMAAE